MSSNSHPLPQILLLAFTGVSLSQVTVQSCQGTKALVYTSLLLMCPLNAFVILVAKLCKATIQTGGSVHLRSPISITPFDFCLVLFTLQSGPLYSHGHAVPWCVS